MSPGPNALGLISAVVSLVPDDCGTVTLIATDETGTQTASGPVAPFRRFSDTDGQEKEIAFTLASMAWTINGAPILTRVSTEKVYAYRAVEALNPAVPVAAAFQTLRALLGAARTTGCGDLAVAIAAALRLRREVAIGARPTRSVDAVVEAFDRWLLIDVPDSPSSW